MNDDFKKTKSYSTKLRLYSSYYKTFSNVLTIRTIKDEYLIAMKLMSGRNYKNDLSDIIGILEERNINTTPISLEDITSAVINLYNDWNVLPKSSQDFIHQVYAKENYHDLYFDILKNEKHMKTLLANFEKYNPGILKETNVESIENNLIEENKSRIKLIEELKNSKVQDNNSRSKDDDLELE